MLSTITLPIYAVFVWLGTLLFLLFLVLLMRYRLNESQKKVERAMGSLKESDPKVEKSLTYLEDVWDNIESLR